SPPRRPGCACFTVARGGEGAVRGTSLRGDVRVASSVLRRRYRHDGWYRHQLPPGNAFRLAQQMQREGREPSAAPTLPNVNRPLAQRGPRLLHPLEAGGGMRTTTYSRLSWTMTPLDSSVRYPQARCETAFDKRGHGSAVRGQFLMCYLCHLLASNVVRPRLGECCVYCEA